MAEHLLIVEDDPTIACDIAMNLEDHGYIIEGIAYSVDDAIEILEKSATIDLVMLDINLEGERSGIDLAKILDTDYGIPFIYLTSYSDETTITNAAGTFPASYLVKPFKESDLAPAVKIALTTKNAARQKRMPSRIVINRYLLDHISNSEYKVIEQIWSGKTNIEIGAHLFISKNTVKTHIRNIYLKLDVHSKTEMLKYLRGLK